MSEQWVLRTRIKRRLCGIVQSFSDERTEWTPAGTTTTHALKFPTRKAAQAAADRANSRGAYFARLYPETELRWDPAAMRAKRAAQPIRTPRGACEMPADHWARYTAALATVYENANANGVTIPAFRMFYVPGSRGACHGGGLGEKYIKMKSWAWDHDTTKPGYLVTTLAHELAHVVDYATRGTSDHSVTFYRIFRKLCPLQFQAYDLAYRPAGARAAGVSERDAAPHVVEYLRSRKLGRRETLEELIGRLIDRDLINAVYNGNQE
jgi:hypothetical protein